MEKENEPLEEEKKLETNDKKTFANEEEKLKSIVPE